MSRIGRLPVIIPAGVSIELEPRLIIVKGPKGQLTLANDASISIEVVDNQVLVSPKNNLRTTHAKHGLYRQLLANMTIGVSAGFTKNLEMKGTGYRAEVQGSDLVLSVGFSHPVRITAPQEITFKVEKNILITVDGIDRQVVGEVAAKIRAVRKPEPYKGKGIRYQGEHIRLKAGKAAKAGAK